MLRLEYVDLISGEHPRKISSSEASSKQKENQVSCNINYSVVTKSERMFWPCLLIPLFLLGCTVGPNFHTPKAALAPEWIEARDNRVSQASTDYRGWWKTFNDPVLDLPREPLASKRGGSGPASPGPAWHCHRPDLPPDAASRRLTPIQPAE
jgi:hypothetical protein